VRFRAGEECSAPLLEGKPACLLVMTRDSVACVGHRYSLFFPCLRLISLGNTRQKTPLPYPDTVGVRRSAAQIGYEARVHFSCFGRSQAPVVYITAFAVIPQHTVTIMSTVRVLWWLQNGITRLAPPRFTI
jgi:hypothetical protein